MTDTKNEHNGYSEWKRETSEQNTKKKKSSSHTVESIATNVSTDLLLELCDISIKKQYWGAI